MRPSAGNAVTPDPVIWAVLPPERRAAAVALLAMLAARAVARLAGGGRDEPVAGSAGALRRPSRLPEWLPASAYWFMAASLRGRSEPVHSGSGPVTSRTRSGLVARPGLNSANWVAVRLRGAKGSGARRRAWRGRRRQQVARGRPQDRCGSRGIPSEQGIQHCTSWRSVILWPGMYSVAGGVRDRPMLCRRWAWPPTVGVVGVPAGRFRMDPLVLAAGTALIGAMVTDAW